jgi:hypothetical protein
MDSGLTIRPIPNIAEMAYARPHPAPVPAAVTTTLAASKAVTAPARAEGVAGHDSARYAALESHTARDVIIDPQTREVIFRTIDVRTRQVQSQIPDAAILRLKAYVRAMDEKAEAHRNRATDRSA